MAISYVNSGFANTTSVALQTSFTYLIPWAQTAGDILIVNVDCGGYTTEPTLTVSDSKNGAYTSVVSNKSTVSGALCKSQQFYFPNITSAGANTNTITLTLSGSGGISPEIQAFEYSGVATSNPLDASGSAATPGTSGGGTVTVTTVNANDLVLTGFANWSNGWTAAGSGFTNRVNDTLYGNVGDERIVTAASSYTDTPTAAAAGNTSWAAVAGAYKAASAGMIPTVTAVSPTSGTEAGGTSVTITGTNFIAGATVKFGSRGNATVGTITSTSITCTSPAGAGGVVDVQVTTSNGTSGTSSADQFTYTGQLVASWSAPAAVTGYKVYWGTGTGNYNGTGSPADVGNTTSYTITGLTSGQRYFFVIKAYDGSGNLSCPTPEQSAVAP